MCLNGHAWHADFLPCICPRCGLVPKFIITEIPEGGNQDGRINE
jgi:hypothetical protein